MIGGDPAPPLNLHSDAEAAWKGVVAVSHQKKSPFAVLKPADTTAAPGYERKLTALSLKALKAQSKPGDTIDWTRPAAPPRWMPTRLAATAVSQFHFGEIATARMCTDIRVRIASPAARDCLAAQAEDEQRHARIYGRYLEKLGGPDAGRPAIESLYDKAASWRGAPEGTILACHILFEGESLQLQNAIGTWMPCPLFKDISAIIAKDEARHVAFGRIYLREALPHVPRLERLALFHWIRQLWFDAVQEAVDGFAPPGLLALHGGRARWIQKEWRERLEVLESLQLFTPVERQEFLTS